jgi:alanine-glyoxylate transaminase/serine-glyoxylate transaminase/serine-pyruvate transaminase
VVNLLERGELAVVGVAGWYGEQLALCAERAGARVLRVEAEWGLPLNLDVISEVVRVNRPKLVALVHGEGSTGVLQPLEGLGKLVHDYGSLLVLDTCFTTAVVDVRLDDWGVDACWAGSQKGLSAYPGLALMSLSPRAKAAIEERRSPVSSLYFDIDGMLGSNTQARPYQTMPAPILYALTEVLQLAYEQGMDYRERRHRNRRDALVAALEKLGLEIRVDPGYRLPSATVVSAPRGIDAEQIRRRLISPFRIEIAGGLGKWSGQVWRIGLMSHSAQPSFIVQLVAALEWLLLQHGYKVPEPGAAVHAAIETLEA